MTEAAKLLLGYLSFALVAALALALLFVDASCLLSILFSLAGWNLVIALVINGILVAFWVAMTLDFLDHETTESKLSLPLFVILGLPLAFYYFFAVVAARRPEQ